MTEAEKLAFLELSIKKLFDQELTLKLTDNLRDLGIDSLDVIELQLNYEEATDREIPDTSGSINTVNDLIKLM